MTRTREEGWSGDGAVGGATASHRDENSNGICRMSWRTARSSTPVLVSMKKRSIEPHDDVNAVITPRFQYMIGSVGTRRGRRNWTLVVLASAPTTHADQATGAAGHTLIPLPLSTSRAALSGAGRSCMNAVGLWSGRVDIRTARHRAGAGDCGCAVRVRPVDVERGRPNGGLALARQAAGRGSHAVAPSRTCSGGCRVHCLCASALRRSVTHGVPTLLCCNRARFVTLVGGFDRT